MNFKVIWHMFGGGFRWYYVGLGVWGVCGVWCVVF